MGAPDIEPPIEFVEPGEPAVHELDGPAVVVERLQGLELGVRCVNGLDPYAVPVMLRRAAALLEGQLGL